MKKKKTKTPKTSQGTDAWVQQVPIRQMLVLPILNTEQEAWILKAERALTNAGFIVDAEYDDGNHRIWTLRVKN